MPLKNARECSRGKEKAGKREDRVSLLLEESRACKSRFGERISSPPSPHQQVSGIWEAVSMDRAVERRAVVEFDLEPVAVEIEGKGSL